MQAPRYCSASPERSDIRANFIPRRREIEPIAESVDESHQIVRLEVIVNCLGQQQKVVALESGDVSHERFWPALPPEEMC